MSDQETGDLTDVKRRRRVVLLCCNFMRNLAFHRTGTDPKVKDNLRTPHQPQGGFWIQAHGNFIDACVLDWCKLFADSKKGKHHWRRVIKNPDGFEADLHSAVGVTEAKFDDLIEKVLRYRDKFVGHLDQEPMMSLPMLEEAKKSVAFLHERLTQEASGFTDWEGLPTSAEQLALVFTRASEAAESVYGEALRWTAKWERDPARN